MTDELYLIAITALLPLTAVMLVLQVNPYQALVMRGILGAIAALIYALFGAADVALTEALVGTMLSITLYAVAVRSSMEMRLGWVQPTSAQEPSSVAKSADASSSANAETDEILGGEKVTVLDETLVTALRQVLKPHHLRLEVLAYPSLEALKIALQTKRIHGGVWPRTTVTEVDATVGCLSNPTGPYQLQTRVERLQEILGDRLPPELATVDYLDLTQASPASSAIALAQSSDFHSA